MKIIASLTSVASASPGDYGRYERAEAVRVWNLYTSKILKEIYLRTDAIGAVLVLECATLAEAEKAIASLPMVEAGLFSIDLMSLEPWPEMTRMLQEHNQPLPQWWPCRETRC